MYVIEVLHWVYNVTFMASDLYTSNPSGDGYQKS